MTPRPETLKDIGEFALIQRILPHLPTLREDVAVGPGDDAAVVWWEGPQVLTTDVLVEGIDFDFGWCDPYSVGFKSLAVNFSDIAAMGGIPMHVLVSWGAPGDTPVATLEEMARGFGDMARRYETGVIGGDLTESREVFINVTVTGALPVGEPRRYNSARPGDGLYVTGNLGEALLGFHLLQAHYTEYGACFADRHLRPDPRVREAQVLLEHYPVTALTDLSDGLSRDLNKLCRASGVGALVEEESVPLADNFQDAAASVEKVPLDLALQGGEDFELLFTVDESERRPDVAKMAERTGLRITRLGSILEETTVYLWTRDGELKGLLPTGWEHFGDGK